MLNITMGTETAEAVKESLVVLTARRVHCEWRPGSCRTIVRQWRSLGCYADWRVDDS
jgi:valyl-tRNA synthetase